MDFNTFKQIVIAKAEALGLTEYELYYQSEESTSVSAFKHEINQFTSSREGGVCFRCIVNGKMGYASTQELSETQAAAIVQRAADNASVLESDEPVFLGEGGKTYEALQIDAYELPATETLIARVLETQEKNYAANPAVIDGCSAQGFAESSRIAIYNSKGLDLEYANNSCGLMAGSVVTDGKEMANSFDMKVGALDTIDNDALTKKAAESALSKLGGEPAPTGSYPVVFSPDAMASLLSTFSVIFSSERAQKGLSQLADKEGEIIAAETVTLVDDPFYKDNPMPINFDAEGMPTYKKNVIEAGVLKTLLYNLKTAAVANAKAESGCRTAAKETTGNASKAGYAAPVAIQPFTMYLQPGEVSEEELLQQVGSGVYINSLGGLHAGANPISGDFSLQSGGFMIENGVKTVPVKSFTVAGNFYQLLKNVTTVASNLELPHAMGMTAYASPSVRVDGLSIAGK